MRKLETDALQEFLYRAQQKIRRASGAEHEQYGAAIVALELELASRNVFDDTVPETIVPIEYFPEGPRQRNIAMKRVREAAECGSVNDFTNHLGFINPAAFRAAWELIYAFRPEVEPVATLLRHLFYWVYVRDDGEERTLEQMQLFLQDYTCDEEFAVVLERAISKRLGVPMPRNAFSLRVRGNHA